MRQETLLLAACLGLTGWLLQDVGSIAPKNPLPACRPLTRGEISSLPIGVTVGIEQIENDVPYLTVGKVLGIDQQRLALSDVVRQKPPRHSVPLRYQVAYTSRLLTSAGMRTEKLSMHCVSRHDINTVVVISPR